MATITGHLGIKNFNFIWKFEDFTSKSRVKRKVYSSPIFRIGNLDNEMKWMILVKSFVKNTVAPKYLTLYVLSLSESSYTMKTCRLKLAFLNNANQEVFVSETGVEEFECKKMWEYPTFISEEKFLEEKDSLLVKGTLSISLTIDVDPCKVEDIDIQNSMATDYESLFESGLHSDVFFMVSNRMMKAHKCILASRSNVFAKMFETNESNGPFTSTLIINKISFNIMEELVRFLYSGKICNDKYDFVKSLMEAATKFEISQLKALCEKILCEKLGIKTACESLIAADHCDCLKLKNKCIDYIITNFKRIKISRSFKKLEDFHPSLVQEILSKLGGKMNRN